MVLVKILKRKDAASVAVAVVVGLIIFSLLSTISSPLASEITATSPRQVEDNTDLYLFPLVLALLELIFLEVLSWIYVFGMALTKKSS